MASCVRTESNFSVLEIRYISNIYLSWWDSYLYNKWLALIISFVALYFINVKNIHFSMPGKTIQPVKHSSFNSKYNLFIQNGILKLHILYIVTNWEKTDLVPSSTKTCLHSSKIKRSHTNTHTFYFQYFFPHLQHQLISKVLQVSRLNK